MLELGSFLNNDSWTVEVGAGHKTENKMCNVHVHTMYAQCSWSSYCLNLGPTSINRRPPRSVQEPTDRKSVSDK